MKREFLFRKGFAMPSIFIGLLIALAVLAIILLIWFGLKGDLFGMGEYIRDLIGIGR
tara:strand:+ start:40 stop:210 length:171 start_codon:yes stop_codon:yes gene_type:complete